MRLSRSFFFILTTILLGQTGLFAQENTASETHNEAFANFLYNAELYHYASEEYEKLLYLTPNNLDYLKKLIDCYKRSDQSHLIETRLSFIDINDKTLLLKYYDLLLKEEKTTALYNSIEQKNKLLNEDEINALNFKMSLVDMNWEQAKKHYSPSKFSAYSKLMNELDEKPFKSPVTASILSGIIPGLGRIYAKDYWDGVLSSVFVFSAGFQSYRRFNKSGISSVGGWIYGGVALGFYVSNIYGSYQSAKYYNSTINEKIRKEAMLLMSADL